MRLLILLHRYIGVAVGLLMAIWCLSGFVMMYQGYPKLDPADRLKALAPLRVTQAQATGVLDLPEDAKLGGFSLEMMAGRPVLQVQRGARRVQALDLATGQSLGEIHADEVRRTTAAFALANDISGSPRDLGVVDVDQWTLDGINRAGPMHHVRFDNPAGTEIYIAQASGQVVQQTTAAKRVVAWFGAIPHWLYPTVLRKDPPLWNLVVVVTSIVGTFLTAIGLYIGIDKFKRYKSGRWSPYRGWFYWHHVTGLVFGVLTLTWVFSGLLTMSPWGFLQSDVGRAERSKITVQLTVADARQGLLVASKLPPGETVTLEAAPLAGRLFVLATDRAGHTVRLDAQGNLAPLSAADAQKALKGAIKTPIAAFDRLDQGDAYYYSGYEREAAFPVYRARLADAQSTLFYLDGTDGRLVRAMDNTSRQSRFWRNGLHDFDFAFLRTRPLWDIVVWILLGGTTAVCVTGAWMSWLRIRRDFEGLRAK